LPDRRRAGQISTLNGVDDDAALTCEPHALFEADVVGVVRVGRGVTDQEDHPVDAISLGPGESVHGLVQGLVDRLRGVAAPTRRVALEIGVDGVDVSGEIVNTGDVLVAAVAVADQRHPHFGGGGAARELIRDRPDLALRTIDQTGHGAGGVEDEGDFDARRGLRDLGRTFGARGERIGERLRPVGEGATGMGDPGREGEQGDQDAALGEARVGEESEHGGSPSIGFAPRLGSVRGDLRQSGVKRSGGVLQARYVAPGR
jgi:hypothetical protein